MDALLFLFRSCVADNALGRAKKYIEVSGRPGPAQFHSPLYSRSRDVYNLTWSVESVPKLDEIRILYRKLMVSRYTVKHRGSSFNIMSEVYATKALSSMHSSRSSSSLVVFLFPTNPIKVFTAAPCNSYFTISFIFLVFFFSSSLFPVSENTRMSITFKTIIICSYMFHSITLKHVWLFKICTF